MYFGSRNWRTPPKWGCEVSVWCSLFDKFDKRWRPTLDCSIHILTCQKYRDSISFIRMNIYLLQFCWLSVDKHGSYKYQPKWCLPKYNTVTQYKPPIWRHWRMNESSCMSSEDLEENNSLLYTFNNNFFSGGTPIELPASQHNMSCWIIIHRKLSSENQSSCWIYKLWLA